MVSEAETRQTEQSEDSVEPRGPLPPLNISGVVVSKAQLLDALRAYLPNIADFSPLPDGQHFYMLFGQENHRR